MLSGAHGRWPDQRRTLRASRWALGERPCAGLVTCIATVTNARTCRMKKLPPSPRCIGQAAPCANIVEILPLDICARCH